MGCLVCQVASRLLFGQLIRVDRVDFGRAGVLVKSIQLPIQTANVDLQIRIVHALAAMLAHVHLCPSSFWQEPQSPIVPQAAEKEQFE